jgi:LPXTG-motif cell wall-anchored protein
MDKAKKGALVGALAILGGLAFLIWKKRKK